MKAKRLATRKEVRDRLHLELQRGVGHVVAVFDPLGELEGGWQFDADTRRKVLRAIEMLYDAFDRGVVTVIPRS